MNVNKSTGKIKFFNVQKGFGFISPDDGGKDLFVHITGVLGDARSLVDGQSVEFIVRDGRKGAEAAEVAAI
jgi:cold shock protein